MIEIESELPATHTLIWLHGLGASGEDFYPLATEMKRRGLKGFRHLLPDAPIRPVTINLGLPMRAWYDIHDRNIETRQDTRGIIASCRLVMDMIEKETLRGISPDHIAIVGFSQGAVIALATLESLGAKLAGIAALSGYRAHLPDDRHPERYQSELETPVFIAHGMEDEIVPFRLSLKSREDLTACGYSVSFHQYAAGHTVCNEEINDLQQWLAQLVRPPA